MDGSAGASERCSRCGGTVEVPHATVSVAEAAARFRTEAAPSAAGKDASPPLRIGDPPPPAPAPPGSLPGVRRAPEWQGVRRGLLRVPRGIRTWALGATIAISAVALWFHLRPSMPAQMPLAGGVLGVGLGLLVGLPGALVMMWGATHLTIGRLQLLSAPGSGRLQALALFAAGGAMLTLVDLFVVAIPWLLGPIVLLVHLGAEIAFLFFLRELGRRFGDTALAANAFRFAIFAVVGVAVVLGTLVGTGFLVHAEMNAPLPPSPYMDPDIEWAPERTLGGLPGFLSGILFGTAIVPAWNFFAEPRLRAVIFTFAPMALLWTRSVTGFYTALLGTVAGLVGMLLVTGYIHLVEEAAACIPED